MIEKLKQLEMLQRSKEKDQKRKKTTIFGTVHCSENCIKKLTKIALQK